MRVSSNGAVPQATPGQVDDPVDLPEVEAQVRGVARAPVAVVAPEVLQLEVDGVDVVPQLVLGEEAAAAVVADHLLRQAEAVPPLVDIKTDGQNNDLDQDRLSLGIKGYSECQILSMNHGVNSIG